MLILNNEASPEAFEEVYEMISEAENQVYKTSKEQMQRLIELNILRPESFTLKSA